MDKSWKRAKSMMVIMAREDPNQLIRLVYEVGMAEVSDDPEIFDDLRYLVAM